MTIFISDRPVRIGGHAGQQRLAVRAPEPPPAHRPGRRKFRKGERDAETRGILSSCFFEQFPLVE